MFYNIFRYSNDVFLIFFKTSLYFFKVKSLCHPLLKSNSAKAIYNLVHFTMYKQTRAKVAMYIMLKH